MEFLNSNDPSTAYDEAQKLIKERGLSKKEVGNIVDQAKGIMGLLGMK